MDKVRWGILGTAKIAREKVVPAMKSSRLCEVVAIASRDHQHARAQAALLGIGEAFGSYDELLLHPSIDAVYIPLPNNLHVPWALKAIQADKHVLCEKPIALSSAEVGLVVDAMQRKPGIKVMEAFMYRFHPQWQHARQLVNTGTIGELKTIQSFFSYYNSDPKNIRNQKHLGGGSLMDIGCYCISLSRFIFGREPARALGTVELDPVMQTDRMASGILDFSPGASSFTCATQTVPYQRVNIIGTEARIEIEIPFNAPADAGTRIWLHTKKGTEEILLGPTNQYTVQCDLFSKAILDNTGVPTPLQDGVNNMKVIESVFKSAAEGKWITVS